MDKKRGFEVVRDDARTAKDIFKDEKGNQHAFDVDITLPTRADKGSAGYDFYVPKELQLLPAQKTLLFTDVKAYMQDDELLKLYIRSSLAVKKGIMLSNNVGIVDASYYSNEGNDGNIGIALVNTSGKAVTLAKGERVAQGIFQKFLEADEDITLSEERTEGFGSSGK